jgi:hypothetical protein
MSTDPEEPLVELIKALLRSTERALETYQGGEPVATHLSVLEESRALANALFERLCQAPAWGWLQAQAITREQFYLLSAASGSALGDPKEQGLSDFDDYDLFRFQWYEEDQKHSYIDIRLAPGHGGPFRLLRRAPEECRRRCLRPDQLAFFRDQLPEVFKRFRQD